jgi:hypothetical protein
VAYQVNEAAWRACQGADILIYRNGGGFLAVDCIAERLNAYCLRIEFAPITPTRDFPSLYISRTRNLGGIGNLLSHHCSSQAIWQFFRREINRFRQEILRLRPYSFFGKERNEFIHRITTLYGFSPILVPKPADWPSNIYIVGHWETNPDQGWDPPQTLIDFIKNGSPPIYIGFGSMVGHDSHQITKIVKEALVRTNQRAILVGGVFGNAKPHDYNQQTYSLDYAPHDWLLTKVSLAIHHGGIGTTTACLRAGKPSVIIPFNYDQPFWGQRVARLGVGTEPLPRKKLTSERLANAIQVCMKDARIQQRAVEIGKQIASENGVTESIRILEHLLQSPPGSNNPME